MSLATLTTVSDAVAGKVTTLGERVESLGRDTGNDCRSGEKATELHVGDGVVW